VVGYPLGFSQVTVDRQFGVMPHNNMSLWRVWPDDDDELRRMQTEPAQ